MDSAAFDFPKHCDAAAIQVGMLSRSTDEVVKSNDGTTKMFVAVAAFVEAIGPPAYLGAFFLEL